MKWLGCLMGLGLLAGAVVESAACSPPFSAGTGGASGSSGSTSGASSSSGTGGARCTATCSKGEYCNPDISACEACAASARFQFGAPVMQAVTLPIAGASALYPRVRDNGDLFLVQHENDQDQIAMALYAQGKAPPWEPAQLVPELMGSSQDSGPLFLADPSILTPLVTDDSITKSGMPVLFFDSNRQQQPVGNRKVFVVILADPPSVAPVVVPLPGNAAHDSSVAVATTASPVRFWWLSDAVPALGDAAAPLTRLVTAAIMDTSPTDVLIMLDPGCPAPLADTPWVTPAGDRLLFASAPCDMAGSSATHLYQAPLGSGGKQTETAQLVFADGLGTTDTTPMLAPDQCTLLFSRVDNAGMAQIFASSRD